jgi:hypothetical protein
VFRTYIAGLVLFQRERENQLLSAPGVHSVQSGEEEGGVSRKLDSREKACVSVCACVFFPP